MSDDRSLEDELFVGWYLATHGYDSLDDWGLDSDYRFVTDEGWLDDDGNVVDLFACCWHAAMAAYRSR